MSGIYRGRDLYPHSISLYASIVIGEGATPISEIVEDSLWIGGYKAPDHLSFKPDLWIHCAEEIRPSKRKAHEVIWLKLDDDDWDWRAHPEEVKPIMEIAAKGLDAIHEGKSVVVTCHMGLNRSGMVTGLIMAGLGFSPGEILALLRSLRHEDVLCNTDFEELVVATGDKLSRRRKR